jgi:hypothetical protein
MMLVIPIQLHSAISGEITTIGTMVIDNIGGTQVLGDYRCRMYRKSENNISSLIRDGKPIREGRVNGHARLKEPVQNLVLKALEALNYKG